MDILKRHWEKILLATALLALIFVGVWLMLKIDAQAQGNSPMSGGRSKAGVQPLELQRYSNGVNRLQNPLLWAQLVNDPFMRSEFMPPPIPGNTNAAPVQPTIRLQRVQTVPFEMLFKAYNWDEAKQQGSQFQADFAFRNRTFFVKTVGDKVGDKYEQTDYVVLKFERKKTIVPNPQLGTKVSKDVSELFLQRAKEEPVRLILGLPAWEKEPVAIVRCDPGFPARPQQLQVRRGQQFECAGTTYIVVDIEARRMLIRDANKPEEQPISIDLPASASPALPPR